MMARTRRYGKSSVKTRVGIATALLAGGAVAAAAVLASGHGVAATATSAAFSTRSGNEGTVLSSAMSNWNGSRQSSYAALAGLTQARQFSQTTHQGKVLAVQRGIVVLATKKFLILQSANGSLHLWLLSGKTQFQNVSATQAGVQALTASASAAQQAMASGNMIPSTTLLAGSPTTAAAMLTPTPAAQTVTVQVANTGLTVTVTVTRTMATVSQTATTPLNSLPAWSPVTFTQSAWLARNKVVRGDLALVAGTRSHWTLKAQIVLFAPLTTADVGGRTATPAT
ncbi:MAG TPA: hypothetical protein VGU21_03745, partial [Streptosporangiaceae bacterium]|nr:hypothetical protein [Streptosporangiaceae bacterium]